MLRTASLLASTIAVVAASSASADVLWDQSDVDPFGNGVFNSVSGGPPFGITQHAVADVSVGGSGWTVDSISMYFLDDFSGWGDTILEGHLHVFDKTGALPGVGDDPTTSPVVAMSAVNLGGYWEVTASGLSLDLDAGDYWIGITPIAPGGGPFGPPFALSSGTAFGDATAIYDPNAFPGPAEWANDFFNPDIEIGIQISGVPTPGAASLLAGAGLVGLRRRR